MRIYSDPLQMVREVERDLFEMGVRYQAETVQDRQVADDPGYQAIELNGYAYALTGFDHDELEGMVKYLGGDLEWAQAEMMERLYGPQRNSLAPLNPGTAWKTTDKSAAKWGPFVRDGKMAYSYAERWLWQLPYVIDELVRRPATRQAMMTVYGAERDVMNWGGRDRVPCSTSYHFLARDGKLTLIYNQRSCDFLGFFATDVYLTSGLLLKVAREVACQRGVALVPGRLVHCIGSLHAFAKDLEGRGIF